ncbi:MAG: rane protein [Sphingobacteriales bacterium]|nr:rane protein [Sphingobacteriales bacterium]
MKNNLYKILSISVLSTVGLASCTKDLDRVPTNASTSNVVYSSLDGYKQVIAKVYASYGLTGPNGESSSDLAGIDAGTSDFLRLYWNAQELSTDEAACVWNDPGVPDFHNMNWTSSNVILRGLYNRSLYQITMANEFIRESDDSKLASRGITGAAAEDVKHYRAEARFLRAFQYAILMDLFGNPPFVTENDPIGKYIPPQIKRADLFTYIESELKAIDADLVAAKANEYGRADQAAAWALLARIYLNAEVYTGQAKYAEAITYATKVINAGYTLAPQYKNLFNADNNLNNPETILSINYDGVKGQSFAGMTFLINASTNAALNPASRGVPNGGWGGNRSTKNLPLLFGDYSGATDKRAMFQGTKLEMDDPSAFDNGLAVAKFSNVTSAGVTAASNNGTYCSTDFPLFRLAEMYLIYAEAVKRGGAGGSEATAISYINKLRERGYGNTSGNITSLNLNDVLDERGRELYWEAFRRTDLVRFKKFTEDTYLWPWKGGVKGGKGVESFRSMFAIPSADINSNPNLIQNTGY